MHKARIIQRIGGVFCAGLVGLVALPALGGVTRTWTGGAGDTDWFKTNNWSPAGVPDHGDSVVIDSSAAPATNVVVSNATANLAAFTITNATCVFTNWDTTLTATNVLIQKNGVLTLPMPTTNNIISNRVDITCSDLTIETGGKIDVDQKGYPKARGPAYGPGGYNNGAGGGYGGYGGYGAERGGGKPYYGSLESPTNMGSGGCDGEQYAYEENSGGGVVEVNASGTVTVDGTISANGGWETYTGGGAGGSIWIIANTLQGTGTITATGGRNGSSSTGGGGGGRISFNSVATNKFLGIINLAGGSNGWPTATRCEAGYPGTFYPINALLDENTNLVVRYSMALQPGTNTFNNLIITNNAILECQADNDGDPTNGCGAVLIVNNLIVYAGARLSADGVGFPTGQGPGKGSGGYNSGGGASHGGYGGDAGDDGGGKVYYGSTNSPTSIGSGGSLFGSGGYGGGAIKIIASGTVTVYGTISANGGHGIWNGGGSGGSVWINANTLEGSGNIEAKGGIVPAAWQPGKGGGGRISFNGVVSNRFTGVINVSGGRWASLGSDGHPGTFYPMPTNGDFTVNFDVSLPPGTYNYNNLTITNSAILDCQGDYSTDSIPSSPENDGSGVYLNVSNLNIATGAVLSVCGLGFPNGQGPGRGIGGYYYYGGGSYGGKGGAGVWGGAGTNVYGSTNSPTSLGSGGSLYGTGGYGGGAIKINAFGKVIVDGTISADGGRGSCNGGGSGGSVWIIAGDIKGIGTIKAEGGVGGGQAGGGGGGRIAVWYNLSETRLARIFAGNMNRVIITNSYTGFSGTVSVVGGTAYITATNGQPGTIVFLTTIEPPAGTIFIGH